MTTAAVFAPNEVWKGKAFNRDLLVEQAIAEFGGRFRDCDCMNETLTVNDDGEPIVIREGSSDERGMGLYLTAEIGEDGKAFLPDADEVLKRWIAVIEKHDPNAKTADQQAQGAKVAEFDALQVNVANWDKLSEQQKADTMKGVMATLVELKANDKSG